MDKLFLAGENPSTDLLEKFLIFKTLVEFSSKTVRLSGLAKNFVFGPGIPDQLWLNLNMGDFNPDWFNLYFRKVTSTDLFYFVIIVPVRWPIKENLFYYLVQYQLLFMMYQVKLRQIIYILLTVFITMYF